MKSFLLQTIVLCMGTSLLAQDLFTIPSDLVFQRNPGFIAGTSKKLPSCIFRFYTEPTSEFLDKLHPRTEGDALLLDTGAALQAGARKISINFISKPSSAENLKAGNKTMTISFQGPSGTSAILYMEGISKEGKHTFFKKLVPFSGKPQTDSLQATFPAMKTLFCRCDFTEKGIVRIQKVLFENK